MRFFFDITILGGSGSTDGDGLLNQWESNGLDMDGDGAVDLNLPPWGADPNRKDIFVEVDCLVAVDHSHCPMQLAMEDVVRAFAEAPVSNPDGTSGYPASYRYRLALWDRDYHSGQWYGWCSWESRRHERRREPNR